MLWWCRCSVPVSPLFPAVQWHTRRRPGRAAQSYNSIWQQRRVRGRHSSLLSPHSPGGTSSEAARPGTCGSSAPCDGLGGQCGVDTGHGSGGRNQDGGPVPSPAQPSPAQPSGDVSISGQPVPPCWPRRRVHRHCSTHKHCTRVPTFLMWSRATAALVQAVLFSSPGSVTEITFFFMF